MRADDDAKDASFGAAGAGKSAEAGNFGDNVIAVHSIFDEVAGDEEIAIEVGNGHVGNDEAVAVLMEDEAAANFVARKGFLLREFFGGRRRSGPGFQRRLRTRGLAKDEAIVGELFDEAAFFEFGEHLEQGMAGGFLDLEGTGEVFQGDGAVSKLKKTQDVIWAEVRRASHGNPFPGSEGVKLILFIFFEIRCNFFQFLRIS
jgi:hypothetical protein